MDDIDYTLIVVVAGEPGEDAVSVVRVSDMDMVVLEPMLLDIKAHQGYYPTGKYVRVGQPTPRDLYHHHLGWDVFESILPKPISGFSNILSVSVFREEPMKMDMID